MICWIIVSYKLSFAADSTKVLRVNIKNDSIVIGDNTDNTVKNRKLTEFVVSDSGLGIDTFQHTVTKARLITLSSSFTCINVNSATHDQLISLHGIGPVLAERIVDYRKKNGKFKNASELIKVKGIGNGKLQKIKDSICF